MRVSSHFNLHTKLFSVVDPKTGRVVDDADTVILRDAEFRVRPAGLEQARRLKKRNVHAYVVGERLDAMPLRWSDAQWHKFRYNPFLFDSFVLAATERAVRQAKYVAMDTKHGTWLVLYPEDARLATRRNPPRRLHRAVPNELRYWAG